MTTQNHETCGDDLDNSGQVVASMATGARAISTVLVVGQVARVVGGLILALLLGVELTGVIAYVLLASLFLDEIMRDVGFGAVLIQSKADLEDETSSFFWFNVIVGAAICGLLIVFGPALADVVEEPRIGDMLRVLGAVFFISSLSTVHWSILRRQLRFRELAVLQMTMTVAGALLPLVLYGLGLREWSMVIALLVSAVVVTGMAFKLTGWRPKARLRRGDLRPHVRFSADLSATKIINFSAANGDRFIVGAVLGTIAFGLYQIAFTLVMAPVRLLTSLASEVLFPGLSRLQDQPEQLGLLFRRSVVVTAVVIAPFSVLVNAGAGPMTKILGGDWLAAESLLAVLAFVAIPQTLMSIVYPVILAVGRTTMLFYWSLVTSSASVIAYVIGSAFGIRGVAWSFLIVLHLLFVPHMALAGSCVGVRVATLLRDLVPVAIATAIAAVAAHGTLALVESTGSPDILKVGAIAGAVIVTYVGGILWLRIAAVRDLISLSPIPVSMLSRLVSRCDRGPTVIV